MIMTIIGIEHKPPGVFDAPNGNKIPYDNIFIYAIKPNVYDRSDSFACGKTPVTLKIKNDKDIVYSIFGTLPTVDDFKSMEGQDFDFFFNEKGAIDRILSVQPAGSKKGA